MKRRLQGLIVGLLIGVLVTGGATYAVGYTTLYDVITDGIKIIVDGKNLIPTDANGNEVQPFIYNGTTYLPVRAVANAFGKAVYWDGPEYTVYLGEMNGKLEYPTIELEDMVSIDQKARNTSRLTDNYGNRYQRAIVNYSGSTELQYLLNMKYSSFKAKLYVPEGVTADEKGFIKIVADGKTIYTSPEMSKTSSPINVDVNVTGYNDVKIEFSVYSWDDVDSYNLVLCLGDAGFYQ